jgi:alpha-D-xyloside xylohydrolase
MRKLSSTIALAMLAACSTAFGQFQGMQMGGDSISTRFDGHWIKLQAIGDNIVHLQISPDANPISPKSFAVLPNLPPGKSSGGMTGDGLALNLADFSVRLGNNGAISFVAKDGKTILAEAPNARAFNPAEVQGEKTFHVRQQFLPDVSEALFGLGQHQLGLVNIKGYDLELWQRNTEIAVPFLVSSKGYGILWDNNSLTKFGNPADFAPIPADHIFDASGNPGGFTRTAFSDNALTTQTGQRTDAAISPGAAARGRGPGAGGGEAAVRWEGTILADTAGTYQFRFTFNGGGKLWIDDKLVADHWRQNWLTSDDLAKADFAAGTKHKIKLEWTKEQGTTVSLAWKTPTPDTPNTSLWSQVGAGIDYYFIYGGTAPRTAGVSPAVASPLDKVIAGYRTLTGTAPMMPVWAFGLWQSRQRYETQAASLDVVKGFRDRKIPFDNIVQDWMYWRENDWGSHQFDPARFPDPDQWIKDIHAQNARLMISVWGKFYPTTDNYKALAAKDAMYPVYPVKDWVGNRGGYQYAFYDTFNPAGRELFWQQVDDRLFKKGVDAWWMDATEPDLVQPSPATFDKQVAAMPKTAAWGGSTGASVMNAYPLLNSQAVYEGQRKSAPDQRVFVLTRSGYAGMQRFGTASWSGDITSTWTAMKKQIAAGLGYSISGLPYWTMDSGGFSVPSKFSNTRNPEAVDEWRELNTRWLQFAAFVPLMRVHGEAPVREMWAFGGETSDAYKAQLKIDQLRYRLLPYIYSLAGDVTQNGGTFMRPLAMDFPTQTPAPNLNDPCAVNDQYMFGPAFMVSPVTQYKARTRKIVLPLAMGGWYDFWTGKRTMGALTQNGGITIYPEIETDAPYDQIPLHIRAGSIIPFGPDLQYTTEKKADPLTLYVYTGADGTFSLYEDDGLTYAYEKGAFSRIPISWNEQTKTLTLAKRQGSFPTMLQERTIQIIFVTPTKPVPYSPTATPDKTLKYTGDEIQIKP